MKSQYLIYLAGAITGQSYQGCTDWRQYVMDNLHKDLVGLSPMRHKDYLLEEVQVADIYEDSVLSCQRGIFARDHWDCHRCDAVLVNLVGTERVSIGTVMEIAWAHAYKKPIVLVMEEGNIHEHAMIREACPFRVNTIDEAIDVLKALFVSIDH